MPRRRGRPGLLGTMARTAVVAGTATATAGAVRGHQAAKQQAAAPPAAMPQNTPQAAAPASQPAAPPAATSQAATSGLSEDTIAKLKELGELNASGVLSDEEFTVAKAKLLGT